MIICATRASIACLLLLAVSSCTSGEIQLAAEKIFNRYGLTMLEPARDYIAPGGIVIGPQDFSAGSAQYFDPPSSVPLQKGNFVQFKAIFAELASQGSTKLSIAVSLLKKIIFLPVGLRVGTDSDVKVSQIDSSGMRMRTDAVAGYLQNSDVAKTINGALMNATTHAFIVIEVCKAKGMDIESTTSADFDVTLGQGAKVSDCSSSTKSASGGNSQAAAADATQNQQDQGGSGVAAAVCRSSKGSLKFSTDSEIPFLVRLAEIEKDSGGMLGIKTSSFKFPKGLGASEGESFTAQSTGTPFLVGIARHKGI